MRGTRSEGHARADAVGVNSMARLGNWRLASQMECQSIKLNVIKLNASNFNGSCNSHVAHMIVLFQFHTSTQTQCFCSHVRHVTCEVGHVAIMCPTCDPHEPRCGYMRGSCGRLATRRLATRVAKRPHLFVNWLPNSVPSRIKRQNFLCLKTKGTKKNPKISPPQFF